MSLVTRVQNILLKPTEEWGVIDNEPSTVQSILTSYVLILAAIGPLAGLIGQQVFGWSVLGVTLKPSIAYSVTFAVLGYVLSVVAVYVAGLVIDALAPSFGGTKDPLKAFKVSVYSWTAAWLAGIFQIIPQLALLGIVGLYSLYLLYLGLPRLMRVPADKALGYTVVSVIVVVVLYVIAAVVVGTLVNALFPLSSFVSGARITY